MFGFVVLQPADSRKELAGLGLKLKHKHGATCFQQPCSAFRGSHCAIYEHRPERCRVFECRQLRELAAGEIAEDQALERIQAARGKVTQIGGLLAQLGDKQSRRRLKQRCDDALAQVPESFTHQESARVQEELGVAMGALEEMLDAEFRVPAGEGVSSANAEG